MGKSLTPSSTFPLAETPGCAQNSIARVCSTVMSAGRLGTLKIFPVMTWQLYSLQFMQKILWCPNLEGWECNKGHNCCWTVILLPQEINKWIFSLPGFQHQQNPPPIPQLWEHPTLPLLLLLQRSRSLPTSPGVAATNWCNASLGATQEKTSNQQNNEND